MKSIESSRLYLISTVPQNGMSYARMAEEAVSGGGDVFQLRIKNETGKRLFLEQAELIAEVCKRYGAIFIVNDSVDIALISGADGVHLGQDDMPVGEARKILGAEKLIGYSTHSLEQAVKAEKEGADYIGVGPIFATPTKPDYKAVGLELIAEVKKTVRIPFVAIGGINLENVGECVEAGAEFVAVVRAVCGSEDIKHNAGVFKKKIEDLQRSLEKV